MKRVIFTVGGGGKVAAETSGYAGDACKAASRPYERALGVTLTDTPTAEAFAAEPQAEKQAEGQ